MSSVPVYNKPDRKFSCLIRGCDVEISKKNIECSLFFSGTLGLGSNLFFYFNLYRWLTRKITDVSIPAKLAQFSFERGIFK